MDSPGNKLFHEIGPIVLACLQKNLQATNRRVVGQNKMVGKRVFFPHHPYRQQLPVHGKCENDQTANVTSF